MIQTNRQSAAVVAYLHPAASAIDLHIFYAAHGGLGAVNHKLCCLFLRNTAITNRFVHNMTGQILTRPAPDRNGIGFHFFPFGFRASVFCCGSAAISVRHQTIIIISICLTVNAQLYGFGCIGNFFGYRSSIDQTNRRRSHLQQTDSRQCQCSAARRVRFFCDRRILFLCTRSARRLILCAGIRFTGRITVRM